MSKQIFRQPVPASLLFNLLDQICLKTDKYYLIDTNAYRKLIYNNLHNKLADDLAEYYHISKQFYVQRKMTYNSFTNVVRQICKSANIMFTSQIKYNESKYNIDYLIYFWKYCGSISFTYEDESTQVNKIHMSSIYAVCMNVDSPGHQRIRPGVKNFYIIYKRTNSRTDVWSIPKKQIFLHSLNIIVFGFFVYWHEIRRRIQTTPRRIRSH